MTVAWRHEAPDSPYRQCHLRRGPARRTTYLPEDLAEVGAVLRLKDGPAWSEGWVVESVHHRATWAELERRPDVRAAGRGVMRWHLPYCDGFAGF